MGQVFIGVFTAVFVLKTAPPHGGTFNWDAGHVEETCEHTCGIKEMLITVAGAESLTAESVHLMKAQEGLALEYLEYYKLITVHHSIVNNSKPKPLLKKWDFTTSE
ncbi:Hypothetical predicted protein [Paramuricea clavata]|uniref:Uncharacterized protein n=1 Tax=Paramuricea clavata TaxID=317549 RepID=A0A7D9ENJ0_PARCT|nr:Hypothetical predicted protein [Paramuricea clavata]